MMEYKDIKTVDDAFRALDMDPSEMNMRMIGLSIQAKAIGELGIVMKAINGCDWDPGMMSTPVYCPLLTIEAPNAHIEDWTVVGKIMSVPGRSMFKVMFKDNISVSSSMLGFNMFGNSAVVDANIGLTGCRTRDIALHLGRNFGKLIFDACYAQYENYRWNDTPH